MSDREHELNRRLASLLAKGPDHLLGPDAQHWILELEPPADWMEESLPEGSLVFANNGVGDNLFIAPDTEEVMVFWHEGAQIETYCSAPQELLPDHKRPPSAHGPVYYYESDDLVRLGDRVWIRYWIFFKSDGTITYVPGVSEKKPIMERDGLAWVRVSLDQKAGTIDTIVTEAGCLQKSVKLLSRA